MLTGLQVPVHNALLVQVAEAADQAPKVVAHLRLCQALPHLQHVSQGLLGRGWGWLDVLSAQQGTGEPHSAGGSRHEDVWHQMGVRVM